MRTVRPIRLGTKAETLERLRPKLRSAEVLPLVYFTVAEWKQAPERCLRAVQRRLAVETVVVRSSALVEDGATESRAGAFDSVLDVPVHDVTALQAAVEHVVTSMTGDPRDQVLVQPMLESVAAGGVVMTYDIVHGSPYFVLNYDERSGRTDAVTAGREVHKALRVSRHADPAYITSPRVRRLIDLARELEALCGSPALDIEFAIGRDGRLWLLQARRIATARGWHPVTERRVARQLVFVEHFVRECSIPQPGLFGRRTILAVMPDWNPAEMIGTTPRPLATSLYRELITRRTWREARAGMGYRELPPVDLMVVVNSHPYIDVRASFNSLLPASVVADTGERLVDAWLDRLDVHPEYHDKVEFEIALTCLDFDARKRLRDWYGSVLGRREQTMFLEQLRALTSNALRTDARGSLAGVEATVATLEADALALRTNALAGSRTRGIDAAQGLRQAVSLIRGAAARGTLAFATVARHAFIAEALLRSTVRRGALAPERLEQFRRSIRTVTGGMVDAYERVIRGEDTPDDFLTHYGHLRPGTYDITSRRYDERDELFVDSPVQETVARVPGFRLTPGENAALRRLLDEAGLGTVRGAQLLDHARRAIAGREHAKFVFTRALSDALDALARWGEAQGLSRDDLSFIDWSTFDRYAVDPAIDYADRYLLEIAQQGRQRHAEAHAFRLGHIVRDARDVYVATIHRSEPNFIGTGRTTGPAVMVTAQSPGDTTLYGAVACIENADPGFDWIFTRGIAALVTKFGGMNSHMAIRCAELGIPAAIGCGEQTFERLRSASLVEVDCAGRMVRPVRAH